MIMKEVKFTYHRDIDHDLLNEIIKIKSVAWPYSYENQKKWIDSNLNDGDIHVLLSDGKQYLAYMNLIKTSVIIDSEKLAIYGIGNVCALEKGKGWGKDIIIAVNQYLNKIDTLGVLFCKKDLVKFYSENGWNLIPQSQFKIDNEDKTIYCMINKIIKFETLQYNGKLF